MSAPKEPLEFTTRLGRVIVVFMMIAAVIAFLVTPILAWSWFSQPFLGMLLEPTLVLSPLEGRDWARLQLDPPLAQPDRLIAIDGQPVARYADVAATLRVRGYAVGDTVRVRVARPDGSQREEQIVLTFFPLNDLFLIFVVPYLVGLAYLAIGIWVHRLRAGGRAGPAFTELSAAIALMLVCSFDLNTTHWLAALWSAVVPFAAAAAMHLVMVFPREPRFVRRVPFLRFLPYPLALFLALYAVLSIYDVGQPWAYIDRWRGSYLFVTVGIFFVLGMLVYRLVRPASPLIRQQSRIILLGATLGFLPVVPWLLLNVLGNPVPFIMPVYTPLFIFFPLSVAYAILRYRLLDIDRLLSHSLAYGVLIVLIVVTYFAFVNGLSQFFAVHTDDPILLSLFVLALVLLFNPLRNRIQRLVDRVFLREPVDYRATLQDFSRELTQMLDLEAVLARVGRRIEGALHPSRQWVFLYDEDQSCFVGRPVGLVQSATAPTTFTPDGVLARWLRDRQECLYLAPERDLPAELTDERVKMEMMDVEVYVPLHARERFSGWLALGPKNSGQPYHSDDLALLSALADQSALGIENARLFASVRRSLDAITEMKNLRDDVFSSIASGVITIDTQDEVTLFNRAAEDILRIRADEAIGHPYQRVLGSLGDDLSSLVGQVKSSEIPVIAHEIQPELLPRGPVWLRLSCSPLKDSHGVTAGVTIVMDDLTEQRRLEAQEQFIRETFQRYVSPAVVQRLLEDPSSVKLGGQRQEVTVLFADIRGFTTFAEDCDPEELVEVLNHYLAIGADAVLLEEGLLDKFMGDAVMAVFNAPLPQSDHALRAVRAALRIREATLEHHDTIPYADRLAYGMGIAVGEAVVGNVGAARQLNYTAIGASINLAKRLQENATAGQILLDQRSYERVKGQVEALPLMPMRVEGVSAPLQVYELLGLR